MIYLLYYKNIRRWRVVVPVNRPQFLKNGIKSAKLAPPCPFDRKRACMCMCPQGTCGHTHTHTHCVTSISALQCPSLRKRYSTLYTTLKRAWPAQFRRLQVSIIDSERSDDIPRMLCFGIVPMAGTVATTITTKQS